MLRFVLSVALIASISGCASTMPAPEGMVYTSALTDPTKCVYLGDVRGDENLFGGTQYHDLAGESAKSKIEQAALKLGGNAVVVETSTNGIFGANVKGKAYKCS